MEPDERTAESISALLEAAYRDDHPDDLPALQAVLPQTAAELTDILQRNIFPKMDVVWGTYTSMLSHMDAEGEMSETGCFRCHDDEHVSPGGDYISQDCDQCHIILTDREEDLEALPDFVPDFLSRQQMGEN